MDAVINIKVKKEEKKKAQQIAEELGFSLSMILRAYLKNLIKTKKILFQIPEEPSEYLKKSLKESANDIKTGHVSPTFDNVKDALAWLDNPRRRYVYQIQREVRKTVRKSAGKSKAGNKKENRTLQNRSFSPSSS